MPRNDFGWSYPPGCSGPPEDHQRRCECGRFEEDHGIDENDNLLGCIETGCEEFKEATPDYMEEENDAKI